MEILFYFLNVTLLFKKILFLFRERGREGGRERKKHQCVLPSLAPPPGDPARNPGMCPDQEFNLQPFGLQAGTQSTEPYQPGLEVIFKSEDNKSNQ